MSTSNKTAAARVEALPNDRKYIRKGDPMIVGTFVVPTFRWLAVDSTSRGQQKMQGFGYRYGVSLYINASGDAIADQVTAAEVYFTSFIAEHNIHFLAAHHFTKLSKVMLRLLKGLPRVER